MQSWSPFYTYISYSGSFESIRLGVVSCLSYIFPSRGNLVHLELYIAVFSDPSKAAKEVVKTERTCEITSVSASLLRVEIVLTQEDTCVDMSTVGEKDKSTRGLKIHMHHDSTSVHSH